MRGEEARMNPEDYEDEKWERTFRPSYSPEWGDGQILLDGEKDFPREQAGVEVAKELARRSEVVGGFVSIGDEDDEHYFEVTAQFGVLVYRCYFPDPEEPVERIVFTEDPGTEKEYSAEYYVEEIVELDTFLHEVMKSAEWTIEGA